VTLGVSMTPGTADISDKVQSRTETPTSGDNAAAATTYKANATEADMIIAVTRNDEINMVICQIAFSIFNIPKKIARIR
jgi:Trk K+ transport system NAD-binding subunit